MPTLSLHQLTALDATPAELIAIAGKLGCAQVCLFTFVPEGARHIYPSVMPVDIADVRESLAQAGVALGNLEVFPLDRDGVLERFREGLEAGAALGACRATVHIHDADFDTAVARFDAFCSFASEYDILPGLEFNAFSSVRDARQAAAIVRAVGRGSVVLDALHLVRGGGGAAEAATIADLVGYAQISDGPGAIAEDRRWREAIGDRLLPGDGEFPLAEIFGVLSPDIVVEVEVPQKAAMKAGVSAEERARRAIEASRGVLARVRAPV